MSKPCGGLGQKNSSGDGTGGQPAAGHMKFVDTATCTSERFSIGREVHSGRYYLSVPVSNRLCDYEEYFEISQADHDAYPSNLSSLISFADGCRARLNDSLLIVSPGGDRGVA